MRVSVPFQYAFDVRAGRIVTGKRIKQAVERFFRWIDEADNRAFYIDHRAGMRFINFFPACLNHTVGHMQGEPFVLAPFQQFAWYNIMGWKKMRGAKPNADTDLRRISTVYDCRGKKNGKTAEMAGASLWMMGLERVNEAQVFVGATKEEQAKLCVKQAKQFISSAKSNPILKKLGYDTNRNSAIFRPFDSVMKALNKDPEKQDGIQVFFGIVDEYHAHPTDRIKENMQSATVLFKQPLMYHITTRGYNMQSPCKNFEDDLIIPVLDGLAEVDHIFAMIHEMDEGDDWEDEKNWVKANPLLHNGLDVSELRKLHEEAKVQPSKSREFKTKNLNMWVDAPSVWIPGEIWAKCRHNLTPEEVAAKFEKFGGYAGGDLSSKLDLTAYVALSEPDEEGNRYIVPRIYCPLESIRERAKTDKVPYVAWMDAGLLTATPGNVVDYGVIEADVYDHFTRNNIERVGFDPWNASHLISNLMDRGITVSEVNQTMATLSEPTKEFEALVHSGKIRHDGNPILAWMISRCMPIYDTKGNMMIRKADRAQAGTIARIDGIAAAINALAESMSGPVEGNRSIYDKPGQEFWGG